MIRTFYRADTNAPILVNTDHIMYATMNGANSIIHFASEQIAVKETLEDIEVACDDE